jgi:RNA polymerase sigma-70 factor (ECF subfamily)
MKADCNNKVGGQKGSQATAAVRNFNLSEISGLVDEAADGNFEAFGKLYSIYLDRIYRYALYQVKDKMIAEDVAEEVFVKAWKAIGGCKGKGRTFSAWIYRIAHNHIINTLRNLQKCVSLDMENIAELSSPGLEDEITPDQQELMEEVANLPDNQRQVVILKFIEGMNNQEIKQITGKSEGAIRILQMRALTRLREKLGGGRYGTRS